VCCRRFPAAPCYTRTPLLALQRLGAHPERAAAAQPSPAPAPPRRTCASLRARRTAPCCSSTELSSAQTGTSSPTRRCSHTSRCARCR
jgi:hypothetical protein